MSKLYIVLKDLMSEQELNIKMLAEKTGIDATCITQYLQAKHIPTVEHLVKLADFFNCSTDYLLGREEESNSLSFKACPPFNEQLEFLLKYFKCKSYYIYNNSGISKSRYYEWKNGTRQPSLDNVIKLADKLTCSLDFILGRAH